MAWSERGCTLGIAALVLGAAGPALAQEKAAAPRIYTCVTQDGRRLTSDRPIAECSNREQRVLRGDGTLKTRLPPAMSPEERAAEELRQREKAAQDAARADAARHDRNLLARFPHQSRHDLARQAALDDILKATEASELRLKELAAERKKLDEEAEFYRGRALPPMLRQQVDANDAAAGAQRVAIAQQSTEKARVNRRFDVELERLRKLWGGAPPGSLGPPPSNKDWELPAAAAAAPASAPPAGLRPPASSSKAR